MGRGVAVVLFTDLVGSTELRGRLGEEATEELRRLHDRVLAEAVEGHGGRVVKGLGDGIMATFVGAADAVAAAVAIQQAIDRLNRSGKVPIPLGVRVGLSAGDVAFEGDDIHGTPVIEAARLCAAAGGGEILASEMVRWLSRASASEMFTSVGNFDLKGLADPVPAVRVEWEPATVSVIPMPALLTDVGRRRHFVGRVEERAVLAEAVKAASAGERQLVLVAGEPGIGKTRLVSESALDAHAEGATVLYGRCGEELGIPYRPIVEAVRHYVTTCPPAWLAVHVDTHGGELGRLIPDLKQLVPGLPPPRSAEPETERFLFFEAVAGLLALAGEDGPVLLVIDDLHWADRATVALVDHLLRWAKPMPLAVVGTYRDSDLSRTHPLTAALADWRRDELSRRVVLRGLSDADAVDLVTLAAGHDLDEAGVAFAHAARRETDGSPFFLVEILRHLREIGALRQDDGRWRYEGDPSQLGVPESVREVIGRRVQRLPEDAARTLGHASVIGREFDLTLLARILEAPDDQVLAGLEEALEARLVAEVAGSPGRFSFAHALVRQTLYEEFSAARRLQLHRRVALALEEAYGTQPVHHLAELAHHWLTAVPPSAVDPADRARAVNYARRAARQASDALAFEQAAGYCEAALPVVTVDADLTRCELLVDLGEARWRSGDVAAAQEAFAQAAVLARRLGQPELLAQAALGFGAGLGGAGNAVKADPALLDLLGEALGALGEDDHPLRVRLLGRLAVELYFTDEAERREATGHEAVAVAQRLDDPHPQLVALYSRHWSMLGPDGVEERQAAAADLARIAEQVGDGEMAFRGHYMRLRTALELGDIKTADEALARCAALADDLRQPFYIWQTLVFRATNAIAEGRLVEGIGLAREAFALGQRAAPQVADTAFGAHMGMHGLLIGDMEQTLARFREVAKALPGEPVFRAAVTWMCIESGLLDEAMATFEAVAAGGFARMPRNGNWVTAVWFFSLACGALADAGRAGELYRLLLPYQGRFAITSTGGARFTSNDGPLGVLAAAMGDLDAAAGHFEAALRLDAASRAWAWRVLIARDYARMLLSRGSPGDAERAREVIDEAQVAARAAGMEKRVEQLEALRP